MSENISNYCKEIKTLLDSYDTDNLIKKVVSIKSTERMLIREKYKEVNGKEIFDDFKKRLNNQLLDEMNGIFTDPIEYDADCLYMSMKDRESLLEMACTRPNWIMIKIMKKFGEKYSEDLEDKIRSEQLGDYRSLLIGILKGRRKEEKKNLTEKEKNEKNEELEEKVQDLIDADEDDWKKLNATNPFFDCLVSYSRKDLIKVAEIYNKKEKKTFSQQIDRVFFGEIKKFIEIVLFCLISPSEYLATRVNNALKGVSVDYRFLIRFFITREEIDLKLINKYYHKLYQKDISDDIDTYIKDDYKKMFLEMLKK